MRKHLKVSHLAGIALALSTTACIPMRREFGDATVAADSKGGLCFSIEDNADTQSGDAKLNRIEVTDTRGNTVWQMDFAPPVSIYPTQCWPLGTSQQGPRVDLRNKLALGEVYEVGLNARSESDQKSLKPIWYQTTFCLKPQQGSEPILIELSDIPYAEKSLYCGSGR